MAENAHIIIISNVAEPSTIAADHLSGTERCASRRRNTMPNAISIPLPPPKSPTRLMGGVGSRPHGRGGQDAGQGDVVDVAAGGRAWGPS